MRNMKELLSIAFKQKRKLGSKEKARML